MALLFMDGFDHYVVGDIFKKWTSGSAPNSFATGRTGNCAAYFYHFDTIKTLGSNYATIIVGMAIKRSTNDTANQASQGFLNLYDGATRQLFLRHAGSGAISVVRGSTALATSADGILSSSNFKYVELKATINGTTGSYEVRVDGATILSGTNVNTQNGSNAYVNAIGISATLENSGGALTYIDDLYVCDTSGTVANDFLGDVVVQTIRPTGAGTNTQFTPLSGANWENVDETTNDGDTTYVSSGTVGHRDTYAMGDIAAIGGTIFGVQVNIAARKEGTVTRGIKPVLKSGASYSLGNETILGTSYVYVQNQYTLNPDGSVQWTESAVNAIEAGVDVTT